MIREAANRFLPAIVVGSVCWALFDEEHLIMSMLYAWAALSLGLVCLTTGTYIVYRIKGR